MDATIVALAMFLGAAFLFWRIDLFVSMADWVNRVGNNRPDLKLGGAEVLFVRFVLIMFMVFSGWFIIASLP